MCRIIPTTWRENGAGIFGDVGPASYKLYVINSLDAEGFDAAGIRGGRQKGSKAKAEDFSVVARVDVEVAPAVTVGGSVYAGDQGQDVGVDANLVLAEAHVMARMAGFMFNALVVASTLDDADDLNAANIAAGNIVLGEEAGEEMFGWYAELGYDVKYPVPFRFRYFQDLNGTVTLPDGFQPERVTVSADPRGRGDTLERTFTWQLVED